MKKIYNIPNVKVVDLEDNICGLMGGSDGDDQPQVTSSGLGTDGLVTGGDAKAERGWASGW